MPRRKALKVVVDVECHAVTCPGVFLPNREEVFINVEIFGQLKRTQYHPPVFPFLFHERIRFEKVFCHATDPVQVAQELYAESVLIELVQLSYPAGEILGTYSDNARDFLFPTPKVSPTYPGVDREILFHRSASFPGISPKFEFSSRTTIKEVTSSGKSSGDKKLRERSKAQFAVADDPINKVSKAPTEKQNTPVKKVKPKYGSGRKRGRCNQRSKSASATTMWGYEQPTIASRARSPSPYTRRRMAELSINDPFESATRAKPFKSEVNNRPNFVVRKVAEDALSLERTPPLRSPSGDRKSLRRSASSPLKTSPRLNSCSSPKSGYNIHLSNSSDDTSDIHTSMRCGRGTPTSSRLSSARSTSPRRNDPSFSLKDLDTVPTSTFARRPAPMSTLTSILNRPTLEERLKGQRSPYEKIRDRVRALLSSPRATRIAEQAMQEGEKRYRERMSRSPSPRSPRVTVHLSDDKYWNEMASVYTGKRHREIFESNLDKIYDGVYTKLKEVHG